MRASGCAAEYLSAEDRFAMKLSITPVPSLTALVLVFLASGLAFVSGAQGQALEQHLPADLAGFGGALIPGGSEVLPFSVTARVAVSRGESEAPLDEVFSVEIVPLEGGTQVGSVPQAPSAADWSLATLTAIEASVQVDADYIPFRGEIEQSTAGRGYRWLELPGRIRSFVISQLRHSRTSWRRPTLRSRWILPGRAAPKVRSP
jgi:hypothetical protein